MTDESQTVFKSFTGRKGTPDDAKYACMATVNYGDGDADYCSKAPDLVVTVITTHGEKSNTTRFGLCRRHIGRKYQRMFDLTALGIEL